MSAGQHSIRRWRGGAALWLAVAALGAGCLARSAADLTPLAPLAPAAALRVRLHFGSEADLDLHVTDPRQETVYFGNNPSIGGGVLDRDLRCDDPAPRTELVTFAAPRPGRYRVGVDFVTKCRSLRDSVPYEVEVTYGSQRWHAAGEIRSGRFEPIVLEFDLGA